MVGRLEGAVWTLVDGRGDGGGRSRGRRGGLRGGRFGGRRCDHSGDMY